MKLFNEQGERIHVYEMTEANGESTGLIAIRDKNIISDDEVPDPDDTEDWDVLMLCKYLDEEGNIQEFYYIEKI